MEHIDRDRLYTDLAYRFDYVCKFVGFGEEDIKALKASAPIVGPLVPTIVEAVYKRLFSFDVTKAPFLKRNENFTGQIETKLQDIKQDSEQIRFRKDMLSKYLVKLVTADYNGSFVKYLDYVGKIHTLKAGNKDIYIEYIHVNALFGYVEDIVISAVMDAELDLSTKKAVARAFNKLLWVQNDLFARYYVTDGNELTEKKTPNSTPSSSTTPSWVFPAIAVAIAVSFAIARMI